MNDNYLTIVGTVLTAPEKRQLETTNVLVVSFRIVQNHRRYDQSTGQWVDSSSFRVKVSCWRKLGENVLASVHVGDPVIVQGKIATRSWTNDQGEPRVMYDVEAVTVGHDLLRGQTKFHKIASSLPFAVIEDVDSESRINGERSRRVDDPDEDSYHPDYPLDEPEFMAQAATGSATESDAMTILRRAGLELTETSGTLTTVDGRVIGGTGGRDDDENDDGAEGDGSVDGTDTDEEALSGATAGSGGPAGRGRRRGRHPVPA